MSLKFAGAEGRRALAAVGDGGRRSKLPDIYGEPAGVKDEAMAIEEHC